MTDEELVEFIGEQLNDLEGTEPGETVCLVCPEGVEDEQWKRCLKGSDGGSMTRIEEIRHRHAEYGTGSAAYGIYNETAPADISFLLEERERLIAELERLSDIVGNEDAAIIDALLSGDSATGKAGRDEVRNYHG